MAMGTKKLAVFIAVILVVAAGAFAAYRLMNPETPRGIYFKAETAGILRCADNVNSRYREIYRDREPYLTGNSRIKTEVFMDTDYDNIGAMPGMGDITGMLGKFSLVLDSRLNPEKNRILSDVSLNLEGVPVAAGRYIKDENNIYITVPTLLQDTYLKADLNNPEQLVENLGLIKNGINMEIPVLEDSNEIVSPEDFEKRLDSMLKGIGLSIAGIISEDDVQFADDDGGGSEINGLKARKLEVTLSPEKTRDVLALILETVEEEDVFNIPGDFMSLVIPGTGIAASQKAAGLLEGLQDSMESVEFTRGLSMELLVDGSDNIVSREALFNMRENKTGAEYRFEINTHSDKPGTAVLADGEAGLKIVKLLDGSETPVFAANMEGTTRQENGGVSVDRLMQTSFENEDNGGMTLEAVLNTWKGTGGKNGKASQATNFDVRFSSGNNTGTISGETEMTEQIDEKNKIRTSGWKINAAVDIPQFNATGSSISINIGREAMLDADDFELPDLEGKRVVDLNTMSVEEYEELKKSIMLSFGMLMFGGVFTQGR